MDNTTLNFGGDSYNLRLAFVSRPLPNAESVSDRDIIKTVVTVNLGWCRGAFDAYIWSSELIALRTLLEQLERRVEQPAEEVFGSYEGNLRLIFELSKRGDLTIHVTARHDPGSAARLIFDIEADQSYLPTWIEVTSKVLEVFPSEVTTSPPDSCP